MDKVRKAIHTHTHTHTHTHKVAGLGFGSPSPRPQTPVERRDSRMYRARAPEVVEVPNHWPALINPFLQVPSPFAFPGTQPLAGLGGATHPSLDSRTALTGLHIQVSSNPPSFDALPHPHGMAVGSTTSPRLTPFDSCVALRGSSCRSSNLGRQWRTFFPWPKS